MSFNTPGELKYTKSHEWVRLDGETATVGITDYAQDSLGDIVYVDLPEAEASFSAGQSFGAVESVKAASDLYLPVDGEVIERNETLISTPEILNSDPYGEGWMLKITVTGGTDHLLDADAYAAYVDEIKH